MIDKIKSWSDYLNPKMLRDPRPVGSLVLILAVLLVTWSGVKAVQTNYELQRNVARLEQENSVHKLENENLALKNEYLKTDQYLELEARRQFGLGAPGESVLLVPKNVALSKVNGLLVPDSSSDSNKTVTKSRYQTNLEDWINFFSNR